MNACCYRFESCTTCPECGGRISRARPYEDRHPADIEKALRQRPKPSDRPDRSYQESLQEDYYDGREDDE